MNLKRKGITFLVFLAIVPRCWAVKEGVTWKRSVDEHFEEAIVHLARAGVRAKTDFLSTAAEGDVKGGVKGNFFGGAIYLEMGNGSQEGPYVIGPDSITTNGRPLFAISGEHKFLKYEDFKKHKYCRVMGFPKMEGGPTGSKQDLDTKFDEFLADLQERAPLLLTQAGSDIANLEENLEDLKAAYSKIYEAYEVEAAQSFERKVETIKENMLKEIAGRYDTTNAEHLYRPAAADSVESGVLRGLLSRAIKKDNQMEFLHSDHYFLYRLTHEAGDEFDSMIFLPRILPAIYGAILKKSESPFIQWVRRVNFLFFSTNDMCYRCSTSVAREYARSDERGLTQLVQHILSDCYTSALTSYGSPPPPVSLLTHSIIIVGSLEEWKNESPGASEGESRRHINYEDDELDYDHFFNIGQVVQWAIPRFKLSLPASLAAAGVIDDDEGEGFNLFDES